MRRPARRPISSPWQKLVSTGLILALLGQSACSLTPTVPDTRYQTSLGRIAVVAAPRPPEVRLEGLVRGKATGAASGAGSSFLNCLGELGHSGCSGDICGAVLIIGLGLCGVAGVVGGVVGAVQAPRASSVRHAESSLLAAVQAGEIQETLRRKVEELAVNEGRALAGPAPEQTRLATQRGDYRALAAAGIDQVLEVGLSEVSAASGGSKGALQLLMQARVRLIRSSDNRVLSDAEYLYQGERRLPAEWTRNNAAPLMQALQSGYAALGAHIHDSVFLLYPFPDRGMHGSGWLSSVFGLAPLEPRNRGQLTGDSFLDRQLVWTPVASTRPTLRWQAFPRPSDIAAAPAEMARVDNVRYDLVIAEARQLAPGSIVYRGESLPRASHTLISPLASKRHYFWSVRARFTLDGRERVTEWGSTHFMATGRLTTPSAWSYRFRTP
ncbi:hypothetical protein [Pseudomonas sp. AN-1]|uniref:hypothetical protein n=1 Tax=Pseudomonas sp. AN-1 TaxID=3096605 RepID=UPI002A6A588A|nr:hypothetical protein [Pseudomonas sp. AN-1]WPP44553.1 hypothetical protein SK095_14920 [Pseudomonas sp. AN-1]